MNCEAYQDLVAAHVDGVLTPAERQEAEAHLGTCEQCRQLFAEEQRFHAAFAARHLIVPVPAEVERQLRTALLAEDETQRPLWARLRAWLRASVLRPHYVLGLAVAGLLIALLLPRLFPPVPGPALLPQAVDYYQAALRGQVALDYATDELRGGTIQHFQDHPTALTVYEGENDPIVCLRQRGALLPVPPGAERMTQNHYLYTQDGYTIVLSQFPDHFCILISRLSREAFLRYLALLPVS